MEFKHLTNKEVTRIIDQNCLSPTIDLFKVIDTLQQFCWGLGYNDIVQSINRVKSKHGNTDQTGHSISEASS